VSQLAGLRRRWQRAYGTLALALILTIQAAGWPAANADERSDAEARLEAIAAELAELQATLERDRGALSSERESLEALDQSIQDNSERTVAAVQAVSAQREAVQQIETEQAAFIAQLERREDALARQILAAWRLSRQSRLKLVLNQDDPARLGRLLAYYDYLGQAQGDQISELRDALGRLDALREDKDQALAELAGRQEALEDEQRALAAQRKDRLALLAQLESAIASDGARLEELQRNRADLEALLERLDDALADIPSDLGSRKHPTELRGALPMPVNGPVRQAFGQAREADMTWQGWLIGAAAGEPVRSIAYGRVAYADWLRGYGLLLIIDHGDGFMTLYGHNESINVDVGDWVEPGTVISRVGQGAAGRQGLYFELRRGGKAVDPAAWISR